MSNTAPHNGQAAGGSATAPGAHRANTEQPGADLMPFHEVIKCFVQAFLCVYTVDNQSMRAATANITNNNSDAAAKWKHYLEFSPSLFGLPSVGVPDKIAPSPAEMQLYAHTNHTDAPIIHNLGVAEQQLINIILQYQTRCDGAKVSFYRQIPANESEQDRQNRLSMNARNRELIEAPRILRINLIHVLVLLLCERHNTNFHHGSNIDIKAVALKLTTLLIVSLTDVSELPNPSPWLGNIFQACSGIDLPHPLFLSIEVKREVIKRVFQCETPCHYSNVIATRSWHALCFVLRERFPTQAMNRFYFNCQDAIVHGIRHGVRGIGTPCAEPQRPNMLPFRQSHPAHPNDAAITFHQHASNPIPDTRAPLDRAHLMYHDVRSVHLDTNRICVNNYLNRR